MIVRLVMLVVLLGGIVVAALLERRARRQAEWDALLAPMKAEWERAFAEIGAGIVPAVQPVVQAFAQFAKACDAMVPMFAALGQALVDLRLGDESGELVPSRE